MTTKERIVDEALTLFSENGFKGTSVKNIADAVGIRDSSLYKHFKSKQEIFDTIISQFYIHVGNMSKTLGLPNDDDIHVSAAYYKNLDVDGLKLLSRQVFLFYLTDSFISRFWKLAHMEQYQNPDIYEMYRHFFMEEGIKYQSSLFKILIEQDIFIDTDPEVMAMNFYAPIFFLLTKYSGRPELADEAVNILDRQVEEFYRIYRK